MKLFEHLEQAESAFKRVDESGLRNITKLAKQYKTATGYFHMDLDGVTSAIAMKSYLQRYGIKTVKLVPINYGSSEFAAAKPKKGTLNWMVDFAHGKPFMNVHTDHHDAQAGVAPGTSTDFAKDPANVAAISAKISPSELFPARDLEVIKTIDSAGYSKKGITPDQVMNAAFGVDDSINVEKNHEMMGLVVNKLLLANKNKKGFLQDLVDKANPSLISMYNTIVALAKKGGFKTASDVASTSGAYVAQQKGAIQKPNIDPKNLKMGQSTLWGTTIVQYGGGYMGQGRTYDRYTPFKLYPNADYLEIIWAMGLIQVSKNPFKSGKNPYNLKDLVWNNVMNKWKPKMQRTKVTLGTVKRVFEQDIKGNADAMGFTFGDFVALFDKNQVKGIDIEKEGGYNDFIKKISGMHYSKLSYKQKELLDRIEISYWDLVVAQSGGHKDITNIQLGSFMGKGFMDDWVKPIASDIAKLMKDKKLEG
jgi:hypothetical protein